MSEDTKQKTHYAFYETANDYLAAFLTIRGTRRMGFGFSEEDTELVPVVTHVFDDEAAKIKILVSSFQNQEEDEIPIGEFIRTFEWLRALRQDETLRQQRQLQSDIAKSRDRDE